MNITKLHLTLACVGPASAAAPERQVHAGPEAAPRLFGTLTLSCRIPDVTGFQESYSA